MSDQKDEGCAEWSILELMGHRRLGKAAIYCLTPTTEEIAKAAAVCFSPPIHRYEIAQLPHGDDDQEDEGEIALAYDGDGQEDEDEDHPF